MAKIKLPIAESDLQKLTREYSAKLLASLPLTTLDRTVEVIRVGAEFPEWMSVGKCLEKMRDFPHMQYCLPAGGEKFVTGHDDDATELIQEVVAGEYLIEALSSALGE